MKKQGDGRRVARVEREVQGVIAEYIIRGLRRPQPGLITVSKVIMPGDLRTAKVFVSVLNAEADKVIEALQKEATDIQRFLGAELKMRFCPKVIFYKDDTTEHLLKIERLIEELGPEKKDEESPE